MCGITILIRRNTQLEDSFFGSSDWLQLVKNNAARGPDSQRREDVTFATSTNEITVHSSISFVASTLHLRGATLVSQPHTSEKSIFCWNGEVFEGIDFVADRNDGVVLVARLDALDTPEDIISFISNIEGPYAFAYYQRDTKRLFFARDPLGRRSLLIHRPNASNPYLVLSSVSAGIKANYNFEEVDPQFIYMLDLGRWCSSDTLTLSSDNPITAFDRAVPQRHTPFGRLARVNRWVPETPTMVSSSKLLPHDLNLAMDQFLEVLDTSVRIRVQDIPRSSSHEGARIAVLYSGGIDSTMVAFLANRHVPLDEPIDLLNVAFENPRKIQSRNYSDQPKRNKKWSQTKFKPLNEERGDTYNVPDRIGGLEELEELRRICPGRQWNFVEIDVEYAESSQTRSLIEDIMLPSRTVMDFSLALALYFVARGVGRVRKTPADLPEPYTSHARVLLNGLGSDELLGGYGRHRSAFNTGSWEGLIDELQLELDRLPSRNLGRDDRMISCHGKETRHPFLSLSVVNFVASLPVHFKVDPRLEIGMGDKMLLRLGAQKLGLECASRRKKRAMQFGSHSARMETGVGDRNGEKILSSDL